MPLHVKTQMITPTERSLTKLATKGFITSMLSAIMETVNTSVHPYLYLLNFNYRVSPHMPAELVRSGELPATILPAAHVWLLARVSSQVRLEVRRLGVCLLALGAGVHHHLLGVLPPPLLRLDLGNYGRGVEWLGVRRVILMAVVTIEGVTHPLVTVAPARVDVEVDIDVEIHSRLLILVTLVMIGGRVLRVR